ncbi:unnamed protein product [Blepharisma stoltei]|uniref:Uncharacterized protein n=1 Tax=Blepharisma stoltei TaxID=1481888 RepID=A0AAU9K7E3_9CILI|nr:unnamed protein product [Blepharisma stoltei]
MNTPLLCIVNLILSFSICRKQWIRITMIYRNFKLTEIIYPDFRETPYLLSFERAQNCTNNISARIVYVFPVSIGLSIRDMPSSPSSIFFNEKKLIKFKSETLGKILYNGCFLDQADIQSDKSYLEEIM